MYPVRILVLVLAFSASATFLYADGMRTWRSLSGSFSVEAELVNVAEGKVELRKADGSTLKVEVKQLSLADVKYVNETLSAATSAFESSDSEKTMPSPDSSSAPASAATDEVATTTKQGATSLILVETDADKLPGWEVDPTTLASDEPSLAGIRTNLVMQTKSSPDLIFSSVPSHYVAATDGYTDRTVLIYDLKSSKLKSETKVTDDSVQVKDMTLSPDGERFAYIYGSPKKLTVIQAKTGKRLWEKALADKHMSSMDVRFLSSKRVAVGSKLSKVVHVFDVASGEPTIDIDLTNNEPVELFWAISPSGTVNATILKDYVVGLIDMTADRPVTMLPLSISNESTEAQLREVVAMSFCRNGQELVVIAEGRGLHLLCFSMKTGRLIHQYEIDSSVTNAIKKVRDSMWPDIEASPNGRGWLVRGVVFVARADGQVLWRDDDDSHKTKYFMLVGNESRLEFRKEGSSCQASVKSFSLGRSSRTPVKNAGQNAVVIQQDKRPDNPAAKRPNQRADAMEVPNIAQPEIAAVENDLSNVPSMDAVGVVPNFIGKRAPKVPKVKITSVPLKNLPPHASIDFMSALKRPERVFGLSREFVGTGKWKTTVLPLDCNAGKAGQPFEINGEIVSCAPDGGLLVCINNDESSSVSILSSQSGKALARFSPGEMRERIGDRRAIFLENDLLLTLTDNKAVAWRMPKMEPVYQFSVPANFETAYRFPQSDRFVHASGDQLLIRNTKTGAIEGKLDRGSDEFLATRSVDIRSDESALAIMYLGSSSATIRIWDLTTGQQSTSLKVSIGFDYIQWCDEDRLLLYHTTSSESRKFVNPLKVASAPICLYDIANKQVVWKYWTAPGSSKWIAVDSTPDEQIRIRQSRADGSVDSLNIISVPSPKSAKITKNAEPPKALLQPGDSVSLVVNVRVSRDDFANSTVADQVNKTIREVLEEDKISISDRSTLKLSVIVGSPLRSKAMYAMLSNLKNEIVWSAESNSAPPAALDVRSKELEVNWEEIQAWLRSTLTIDRFTNISMANIGESYISINGEQVVTPGDLAKIPDLIPR